MDRPVTLSGPEQAPARGGAPDSLVIFLHGYGSNGDDLIALAKPFSQALPGAHFLSPHAIEPCPGAPGGHQWFPLSTLSREERDAGVAKAGPVVAAYVEAQLARFALAPERCVLVGFSQGTMLALHVGLRFRPQLAGVLGYSGALARIGMLMDEIRARPPVHLIHGDQDPVVPAWMMFEAFGALEALQVPVNWHISRNTPHSIAPDGLEVGARFLRRVLG